MKIKDLKTIKNYANSITLDSTGNNPSVQYVYKMIEKGEVKGVIIDGVKFVDVSKTELIK